MRVVAIFLAKTVFNHCFGSRTELSSQEKTCNLCLSNDVLTQSPFETCILLSAKWSILTNFRGCLIPCGCRGLWGLWINSPSKATLRNGHWEVTGSWFFFCLIHSIILTSFNIVFQLYYVLRFWCFREVGKISTYCFKDVIGFHSFVRSKCTLLLHYQELSGSIILWALIENLFVCTSEIISSFQEKGTFNPEKPRPLSEGELYQLHGHLI